MKLSQLPGYTRAGERGDRLQEYWRNFAFLGLTETLRIAGGHSIEVRQLTLRMFVQLCAVRSPFFVGGRIGPEHVAQVLWRISPEYDTRGSNPNARKDFVATIAGLPFKSSVRAVDRYIDRQLMDKPPVPVQRNDKKSDTSFAASMVHALSSNYGWSDELILDQPLTRMFQYLRRIRRENDPELCSFNPLSDRFTKRITDRYLNRKKENAECGVRSAESPNS